MSRALALGALGLVMLLAAGLFDAEPLYVPGIALPLAALAAAAWVRLAARGVSLECELGARRIVEDEALAVRLVATPGPVWLPGGEIVDALLPEPAPVNPGAAPTRVRIQVTFARRGRRLLPPPLLRVSDPLGIATREAAAGDAREVLVLPRTFPVRAAGVGVAAAGGRGAPDLLGAAAVEIDGLRPHDPASPASRIHWQSLAKGSGLLERRLTPERDDRPLVLLDPSSPSSEDALDAAVRAAASLCLALASAGGCAVLLPGDRRATVVGEDLGAWPLVHTRLALVAPGRAPAAGLAARRTGPLLWVHARGLAAPPRALARAGGAPGGRRIVVTTGAIDDGPRRRVLFTVAGCTGYELAVAGARRVAA
jgi:uncharacterized protein (DUF58 family)